VFDGFGRLALAIAAMGPSAQLDLSPEGWQAATLRELGRRVSLRLGAPERAA
jgi:DNA-binding IclR family transcriptional regulator